MDKLQQLINTFNGPLGWEEYFFCLSLLVSSRSPCHRLHVGCVIVKDRRILATGYNGFLSGAPHESIVKNNHEQATVHAEVNAICYAAKKGASLDGATAYVTHYPCLNCCKSLIASGIKHIKYLNDYHNDPLVARMCNTTGVSIHQR